MRRISTDATRRELVKRRGNAYLIWVAMRQRCSNPNDPRFANYGGRGVSVCERWRTSFEAFVEDMGERPSSKHSIDRIDNDGNYEPGNCRWATNREQCRNRRNNILITHDGHTATVEEWSERLGLRPGLIAERLRRGWSERDALLLPIDTHAPRYCRRAKASGEAADVALELVTARGGRGGRRG